VKEEKASSFVKFFKSILGKLPEQKELKEEKTKLRRIEAEKDSCVKRQGGVSQQKERLNFEFDEKTKKLYGDIEGLEKKAKPYTGKLATHADGKIIGDGRSDFTRTVTSYKFEVGDQKFNLLDLPGIEGNEGGVLDAINSAVQKAHAVFYVTSQPNPPQTGDKNSEGTLDKIKKHLGQQTEVYTIFNKRVKNPNSFKDSLIDSDESESLKVLDKTMRSYLGEQYQESISLSAYPAFLAVGNCWGEEYPSKKEKFLERFNTSEAILEKSHVQEFSHKLTGDLVNNSKVKIKKSNFKKTAVALMLVTEKTGKMHKNFLEFQNKLIETKALTDDQLDNASDDLKGSLDREAHTAVEKFKNDVRKKVYADIESDIDNKEFKAALEKRSKEGIKNIQGALEKAFKDQIDKFQGNISDIVKKYQEYSSELLSAYVGAEKFDTEFNLNIDIKSGINWAGTVASVVSAIVGIVLASIGTVGVAAIVAIVLAVIGGIISVAKAVAGFFNHNYRKSQQRKNADKALEESGKNIYDSIKKNLADCYEPLKSGMENVKSELTKTVDHIKERNRILEETILEFKSLTKAIVQEGDQ
jgi:hypothetical protein